MADLRFLQLFHYLRVPKVKTMTDNNTKISIFQRPVWVVVFALTAAVAWG